MKTRPSISRQLILAAFLAVTFSASPLAAQQAEKRSKDETLVYSLYVMRHGVRSPTANPSQYDRFSSAPWPTWNVAPGYLTAHGYQLIKLVGAYEREALTDAGLFSQKGCGDTESVFIHADSDERTRETARALSEGMFPDCHVPVHSKDEDTNDPLFHVPPGGITSKQSRLAAKALLDAVGDDPANVAAAYKAPLNTFDDMLATCGVASPRAGRTSLLSIPAGIVPGKGDRAAEMKGPINTASTLTEIMLLEYAEGFPAEKVGWGCVDGAKIRAFIDLHTAASEIALRNPAVAVPQAKTLLRGIAASLDQAASSHAVDDAEGKPQDRLTVLVGHDTNLNNIAGALRLDWLIDGRRNDTPPGSALVFDLLRRKGSGELVVRLSFTTQTLEQMRQALPLTAARPAPRVPVFVPGCSGVDGACPLSAFLATVRMTIAP